MLCRWYEPHIGGVERHVKGLARELRRRKHQLTIITEQYQTNLPLEAKLEGVKVWRIPYPALKSKRGVWQWLKERRELVEKADLVHIHDVFWWYAPTRLKLKQKPVYITFHGCEGSRPPRWQAVVQRKTAETWCRGWICIGGFMKKWYLARPDIILYGAAEVKPAPWVKSRSAVYLGRLDEDAGILEYIKAIQIIKPEITLDVYGDGPQAVEARQMVKQRRLPVAFHGWSHEGDKGWRKTHWAMVSRYLAILEAMQAKRLVVAVYNNRIKRDYLLCHPQAKNMLIAGGAEAIAEQMMALTAEAERAKINQAYRWAKGQTWSHLADKYEQLWKR